MIELIALPFLIIAALLNILSISYIFYYVDFFFQQNIAGHLSSVLGGLFYVLILISSFFFLSLFAHQLQDGFGNNLGIFNVLITLFALQSLPVVILFLSKKRKDSSNT